MRQMLAFVLVFAAVMWFVSVAATLRPPGANPGRLPLVRRGTVWPPIDRFGAGGHAGETSSPSTSPTADGETTEEPSTDAPTREPTDDAAASEEKDGDEKADGLPPGAELILQPTLDLDDSTVRDNCHTDIVFNEADLNVAFMRKFGGIFKRLGIHWWLDEGGLIGASRAGSMANADDDFDFFALLPNQIHPCRPDSYGCDDKKEFNVMIHKFLSEFWNEGMCVNNFHPDINKFNASGKLMYSFMLDRSRIYQPHARTPGARCFEHGKTPRFAHMHLGLLTPEGELATNVWAPPLARGGHAHDKIPLRTVLPVRRCRAGPVDAPCPNNIEAFLKLRNEGEYGRASSQGSCLLVRKKWATKKKLEVVRITKELHRCGYNSMHSMVSAAEASGYRDC
eukprot:TRINITY_DN12250_c0_g1_i1.p1 TRINITY_DN12250_c0_g1~~TRINITY_DN12250_c0_g1_i1.p1  ORF type:complete len:395 (+),score=103.68 TRINITY_DN12250_c0_g1_i1:69-1253(+)